jgi:hypothetical protein
LTQDEGRRIMVERYDRKTFGTRGVEYIHKDQSQRFFRIHKRLIKEEYL